MTDTQIVETEGGTELLLFAGFARDDRHERAEMWEADQRSEPCLFCGRKVRIGPNTVYVHLVNGGEHIVPAHHPYSTGDCGDLGLHPVGPDCARRLPPSYRIHPVGGEVCDHCTQPVYRDVNGFWCGADGTSDCPASERGHEVDGGSSYA